MRRLGTLPIQLVPSSTLQRSQQKGATVSTSLLILDKAVLAFSDRIWRITPARAGLSFTAVPFNRKDQVNCRGVYERMLDLFLANFILEHLNILRSVVPEHRVSYFTMKRS